MKTPEKHSIQTFCQLAAVLQLIALPGVAADKAPSAKSQDAPHLQMFVYTPDEHTQSIIAKVPEVLRAPELLTGSLATHLITGFPSTANATVDGSLDAMKASTEKFRGIELVNVYKKSVGAIPVIVVGGGKGYGSGFFLKDGWIVTNHHVAKDGILSDQFTREVTINLGTVDSDGHMKPMNTRYTAEVYKWDPVKDLALLRLKDKEGSSPLPKDVPYLTVASGNVPVGEDVAAIGNAGITLLWSLKPGVVQGVGRNVTDSAEVFRLWDERTAGSMRKVLGSSYSQIEEEVQKQLGPKSGVLLIQATCPILPGDSGGPLLNMKGEVVGVTDFYKSESTGGHANYFIHAEELRAFLKDYPTQPLRDVPSLWEMDPDAVKLQDVDRDGKPETVALFRTNPNNSGMRATLIGLGWDLNEETDFSKFQTAKTQQQRAPLKSLKNAKDPMESEPQVDVEALYKAKGMKLQCYLVRDGDSMIFACDMENNGQFSLVRIDANADSKNVIELRSDGPDKPFHSHKVEPGTPAWLETRQIPDKWRRRYQQVVINLLTK